MGKELAKFEAEHKKIKAQTAALNKSTGETQSQRMRLSNSNVTEGEAHLRSCLVKARKAGVTGDSFNDFAKNKDFQEGMKLLNVAAGAMEAEIKLLDDFSAKAAAGVAALEALAARIDKDLVKRKDTSETKKDIEAMVATVAADIKALKPLAGLAAAKILPYHRGYTKAFQTTIAKILKEAPDAVQSQAEGNELPHKLTDRVLNTSLQKCLAAAREVRKACDEAMNKAAAGDKAGAQAAIKKAGELRKAITPVAAEYKKIATDYKQDVDNSKDKKKVLDAIAKMSEADDDSERAVRGLATTMKKAG
jgi:hypothetical protein